MSQRRPMWKEVERFLLRRGFEIRNLRKSEKTNDQMSRHVNIIKTQTIPLLGDLFGGLTTSEKNNQVNNSGGFAGIDITGGNGGTTKTITTRDPTLGGALTHMPIGPSEYQPQPPPGYPEHPDLPGEP